MFQIFFFLILPILVLTYNNGIGNSEGHDATKASTFGSAGKGIKLHPSSAGEQILWEQNCTANLCILDHQWYGGRWNGYDTSRLRFYVDGEKKPSIDGQMFLSHGIGFDDDDAPWSAGALFGKTGSPSGVFNTFNIPFQTHIRCSILTTSNSTNTFWWIYRGYQLQDAHAGLMIGRFSLPSSARLRLFTIENRILNSLEFLPLFNMSSSSGMVLMTSLSVNTSLNGRFQYLEACYRTYTNGTRTLLSSGTEDYFLGTYYFNKGMYHNPMSGLTHKVPQNSEFSAYRIHIDDPIIFQATNGPFSMVWRNGEKGSCEDGSTKSNLAPAQVSAYSWVYVW